MSAFLEAVISLSFSNLAREFSRSGVAAQETLKNVFKCKKTKWWTQKIMIYSYFLFVSSSFLKTDKHSDFAFQFICYDWSFACGLGWPAFTPLFVTVQLNCLLTFVDRRIQTLKSSVAAVRMALLCRYACPVSHTWKKSRSIMRKAQAMLVLCFYRGLRLEGSSLQTRAPAVHALSYGPSLIAKAVSDWWNAD